jgi:transposase
VSAKEEYQAQRLDHLGIVAGVCRQAGIAEWLDNLAGENRRGVSIGTATVAMILNGLGFSNRQLYLVPQYFENKPVEHLLGKGISADQLNDDCLGRTLDWIYEHDVTILFAGLALQARQRFGIKANTLHVDTTSFSVSGEYASSQQSDQVPTASQQEGEAASTASQQGGEAAPTASQQSDQVPTASQQEGGPVPIAITYGYSRDHREDLKQWMLALATTHDGEVPIFLRPLDGNSSDKEHLSAAVKDVMKQLREQLSEEQEQQIVVFDSGGYSQANILSYNEANILWISRVPETSTAAKTALQQEYEHWQPLSNGSGDCVARTMDLPQGKERWIIVRPHARVHTAKEHMEKKVKKTQERWTKKLWHLSVRSFSCEKDAEAAWKQGTKGMPSWLVASFTLQSEERYDHPGKPKKGASPQKIVWHLIPTISIDQTQVQAQINQDASFIIATNILDEQELSHEQVMTKYKEQGGVERGFRFLKDPLFLASSVFVKKPERVVALSFIMVLSLLVYRLAEHLLRTRLAETEESVPNQIGHPTQRPTMRWIFQCFEGIDLLHIRIGSCWSTHVLGLQALHRKVLHLLGPPYARLYGLTA